jgi:hypothetical protein
LELSNITAKETEMQNTVTTPPPPLDIPGQSNEHHTAKRVSTNQPTNQKAN